MHFYLITGGSNQIKIKMSIKTNDWDVETYKNKLKKLFILPNAASFFCFQANALYP